MKQLLKKTIGIILSAALLTGTAFSLISCNAPADNPQPSQPVTAEAEKSYTVADYSLTRNGISLHLDRTTADGTEPQKKHSANPRRYIFVSRVRC